MDMAIATEATQSPSTANTLMVRIVSLSILMSSAARIQNPIHVLGKCNIQYAVPNESATRGFFQLLSVF
jgi:hypothetical protein